MDNRTLLRSKAETLAESEVDEVLEYIEIMEAAHQQPAKLNLREALMLRFLYAGLRNRGGAKDSANGH